MSNPYLGEIRVVGFNFAPRGWALCNGQLLPISQNTALFSILGTNYGGNGQSTFALPNLQATLPISQGQGPGLTPYVVGETTGTPTVTVLQNEMPLHTHGLQARTGRGGAPHADPVAGDALTTSQGSTVYGSGSVNTSLNPSSLSVFGGNQPHNNLMPTLVLTYIIALQGIFPARN